MILIQSFYKQIFKRGAIMKYKLLNKKINETNNTISKIAENIGISQPLLESKLCGKSNFDLREANALGDLLCLSKAEKADIFFGSEADNE